MKNLATILLILFTGYGFSQQLEVFPKVLTERQINGAVLTINCLDTNFIATPSHSRFRLRNFPAGVTISGGTVVDTNTYTLTLSYNNKTNEFDSDSVNCFVEVDGQDIMGANSSSYYPTDSIVLDAFVEAVSISFDHPFTEQTLLDDDTIYVELIDAIFEDNSLSLSLFTVNGEPSYIHEDRLIYVDSANCLYILRSDTVDFETNTTNITITVDIDELAGGNNVTSPESFDIIALHEAAFIEIVTPLNEYNIDGSVIGVALQNEKFEDTDITGFNLVNFPPGTSIQNYTQVNDTLVNLTLNFDFTDFDSDYTTAHVRVDNSILRTYENLVSDNITIEGFNESATITVISPLTEANLHNSEVQIHLNNIEFETVVDKNNFILINSPSNTSVFSASRLNDTLVQLILHYDGTDFDSDIANFRIEIQTAQLTGNISLQTNDILIDALTETASLSPVNELSEDSLHNDIITVILSNEQFNTTIFQSGIHLINFPPNVTIGALNRISDTQCDISLSFSGDYDASYPNAYVKIDSTQLTRNASLNTNQILVKTLDEQLLLNATTLNEANLNGAVIDLTIINESLTDTIINPSAIMLNNVPPGVSIDSFAGIDLTHIRVFLQYNLSDFDINYPNFTIALNGSELSRGVSLTTASSSITALDEKLQASHAGLNEENLDGAVISLNVIDETFKDLLFDPVNITMHNAPLGVSISQVLITSPTTAQVELSYDNTDFDATINNLSFTISSSEFSRLEDLTSNNLTITATIEPAQITVFNDGQLQEEQEAGEILTIKLIEDTFDPMFINTTNVTIQSLPQNVTISSVNYIDSVTLAMELAGNRITDYDTDWSLKVLVHTPALTVRKDSTISSFTSITAYNDTESIVAQWNPSTGTNGAEATLDSDTILISLTGGTFRTSQLTPANIWLSGDGPANYGISIDQITDKTPSSFKIALNWNETDFDGNPEIKINISGNAYDDGNSNLISSVFAKGSNDPESIALSFVYKYPERYLDDEILHVTITGGVFKIPALTTSNISIGGPGVTNTGLSVEAILNKTSNSFDIALDWDNTDFDQTYNLTVTIDSLAFSDADGDLMKAIPVIHTLEKVIATVHGTTSPNQIFESDIQSISKEAIISLALEGADWAATGNGTNNYNSSLINQLYNGFSHYSGFTDAHDKIVTTLINAISGARNIATTRVNDTLIEISIPAIAGYVIDDDEVININVPVSILEGTNGQLSTQFTVIDAAQTSAHLFALNDEFCTGDSTQIFINIGGTPPFRLIYHRELGGNYSYYELNTLKNTNTIWIKETGTFAIDTLDDLYRTLTKDDATKVTGIETIIINPLPNVKIADTIPTVFNTLITEPFNLAPYGTPSNGKFSGPAIFESTKEFYPFLADPENEIVYSYTDANGCTNSDTIIIRVLEADGTITFETGVSENICFYQKPFHITGENVAQTNGTFRIEPNVFQAIIDHGDNTATIDPEKLLIGIDPTVSEIKNFTIIYTYKEGESAFDVKKDINIQHLYPPQIQGLDTIIFCKNSSPVEIISNYNTGNLFTGPGNTIESDFQGRTYFYPARAQTQQNLITLSHTSSFGCIVDTTVELTVYSIPEVNFGVTDKCINEIQPTQFRDSTTSVDPIISWSWNFDDINTGELNFSHLQHPVHQYSVNRNRNISLTVVTNHNCIVSKTRDIHFGLKPKAGFYWDNECFVSGKPISFTDTTKDVSITSRTWKFEGETRQTANATIKHAFSSINQSEIQLAVLTTNGCADTVTKNIELRQTVILADDDYYVDFESGNSGWVPNATQNSPWKLGTPDGTLLNSAASGSNAMFALNNMENLKYESGSVISPCLDFSGMERPMIKLKLNYDLFGARDFAIDGFTLSYSLNNGLSWTNIGNIDEGINWFNSFNISRSPGGQKIGWSGTSGGWIEARNKIPDEILNSNGIVRIALAYASDSSTINEGVVIDDIWIGEKKRKVLLEYFTNSLEDAALAANTIVNSNLNDDVINIQYHSRFPEGDPFYAVNSADQAARGLYYGIRESPFAFMDGTGGGLREYDFITKTWNNVERDLQSLSDPGFGITVQVDQEENWLSGTVEIEALNDFEKSEISLHIVAVEHVIELDNVQWYNTFRKMIPDAGGTTFNKSWKRGDIETVTFNWTAKSHINTDNLKLVAFMQNDESTEIYQAELVYAGSLTGINDMNTRPDLIIYPNPADRYVIIKADCNQLANVRIELINQTGQLVKAIQSDNSESELRITIDNLSSGFYTIRLISDNQIQTTKLIINR